MLAYLEIEQPNASRHPMFKEDEETGLSKKLTRKEQKGQLQDIPKKLRGNNKQATEQKEDAHKKQQREDCNFARGETTTTRNNSTTMEKPEPKQSVTSCEDWSSTSENTAAAPKRPGVKKTPLQLPRISAEATPNSIRNR